MELNMTQDEIIEMAIKVDLNGHELAYSDWFKNRLKAFAKLVAEKEREEIAQFIERTNLGSLPEETALHYANLLRSYSTAIRARGQA
jgi:hypothetical protein